MAKTLMARTLEGGLGNVSIEWDRERNEVSVHVVTIRDTAEADMPYAGHYATCENGHAALDMFHHPFAYFPGLAPFGKSNSAVTESDEGSWPDNADEEVSFA